MTIVGTILFDDDLHLLHQ